MKKSNFNMAADWGSTPETAKSLEMAKKRLSY